MTVYSQNQYSANDRSLVASYTVPGGKVALRKGNVSVVLIACLVYWHNHVEPLVWPGVWGYAERTIRGDDDVLSNHASGTAVDANAPQHPLGTKPTDNFTAAEIEAIRWLLDFCDGVVRWGGDYTGRKDGMHLEINQGQAAVDRLADKIEGFLGIIPAPGPPQYPPPTVRLRTPPPWLRCNASRCACPLSRTTGAALPPCTSAWRSVAWASRGPTTSSDRTPRRRSVAISPAPGSSRWTGSSVSGPGACPAGQGGHPQDRSPRPAGRAAAGPAGLADRRRWCRRPVRGSHSRSCPRSATVGRYR